MFDRRCLRETVVNEYATPAQSFVLSSRTDEGTGREYGMREFPKPTLIFHRKQLSLYHHSSSRELKTDSLRSEPEHTHIRHTHISHTHIRHTHQPHTHQTHTSATHTSDTHI